MSHLNIAFILKKKKKEEALFLKKIKSFLNLNSEIDHLKKCCEGGCNDEDAYVHRFPQYFMLSP